MMLGIRAIQKVEESARGDGKGYFRIAVQRRPPAAAKAIKHPGAAAQTPSRCPSTGQDPSRLDPMAVTTVWGGLLDGANEGLSSLLVPLPFLQGREQHLCGKRCPPQGRFPLLLWTQCLSSSQNSHHPETISKS